jgi:DNA-directed RNA polymerase subunit RPC12/RpoP
MEVCVIIVIAIIGGWLVGWTTRGIIELHINNSHINCRWKYDEDGKWDTSCGESFCFIEDGPKENNMKFCPYCGSRIIIRNRSLPWT